MAEKRKWLVELRKKKGWTQKVCAEKAGISESYIEALELGTRNAPVHTAKKVAAALGFDWQQFFE
jgi:transcriptional regulator with XRE-family HTH domain